MAGADCLVLLSDVDGLYTAPPAPDPDAAFVDFVPSITPAIEAMAGAAGSELSRGGMKTKIEAGKIATAAGAAMVIASGRRKNPLAAIDAGERATWFAPQATPATARKAWIAGHLEPRGAITVDAGAEAAIKAGKSLLPAGVTGVSGHFSRGDAVIIRSADGARDRPRPHRLRPRGREEDRRQALERNGGGARLSRPRRDDPPRRHGAQGSAGKVGQGENAPLRCREVSMLFMVVESFRGQDGKAVYRRFRDKGRMMPDGLKFVASWTTADLGRCFQVMEADDVTLLQRWVAEWSDVASFEIVPVVAGKDTAEALAGQL